MPIDWRRREKAARFDHGGPIRYISLAPVAGVMLVVAAVTAMAYPAQQHIILLPLAPPADFALAAPSADDAPDIRIGLDQNGKFTWNGEPVTQTQVENRLWATLREPLEPTILFDPDDHAAYGATLPVLDIFKRVGILKFCFGGLTRNQNYDLALPSNMDVERRQAIMDCAYPLNFGPEVFF